MRLSQLVSKTSKTAPGDEVSRNGKLLIQAGYVYKVMAGVYAYTPLGIKVLENIKEIVRQEMNAIGGQELIMSTLQRPETWQTTGRWDDEAVDVWFKTRLKDDAELGLAWSHEEAILEMCQHFIKSYKDLPLSVYQFQTKFRNELRAKSGIMRGREFVMKDMYSMHASQEDVDAYYDQVIEAYKRVFDRLGVGDTTYVTFASGGSFTKFSHEFQTICEAGEDVLYVNEEHNVAVNEEVLDEAAKELGIDKTELKPVKSAESGNIFKFGTGKSEDMGVFFTDEQGERKPVYLASYGIGITRMMGLLVEMFADEKGLVWPAQVAPAQVAVVRLGDDAAVVKAADDLYEKLQTNNIAVIYDDRDERPGTKFADVDLLGVPLRVVVSAKTLAAATYEVKARTSDDTEFMTEEALLERLSTP